MKKVILYLAVILLFTSCICIRASRPYIDISVFDAVTKKPLTETTIRYSPNQKVNVNTLGKYFFKQKTYVDFSLPTMEAPRELIMLHIESSGYKDSVINLSYRHGIRRGDTLKLEVGLNPKTN